MVEDFRGVLIVGGGIVGTYAALSFAQRGYSVRIMEFRPNFALNASNETLKRSINLAFSFRGRQALKKVGLLDQVEELLVPMRGRAIHIYEKLEKKHEERRTSFHADQIQPYDEVDSSNYNNSISRTELNLLLLRELNNYSNVTVEFDSKLTKVSKDLVATFTCQGKERQIRPVLLLGCDGAHSATRASILRLNFARYEQFYIPHGYKEFTMEAKEGAYRLPESEYLHIWPRSTFMMIALPNTDKTFTCTLFAPMESLQLSSERDIEAYFKANFPDFFTLIPDFVQQYRNNPASRLVSVYVDNWKYIAEGGKHMALLLGDAAHACVPFYGIGMNCGLEDVLELCNGIDSLYDTEGLVAEVLLARAVTDFNKHRVQDGHCCSQISYENYREMSHHTMSRTFLLRKKVEGLMNWLFGESFVPLYKMVSFTRIPFSEVVKRDKRQQQVLNRAINLIGFASLAVAGAVLSCLVPKGKISAFGLRMSAI